MIRLLMAGTAVAAVLATSAFAQSSSSSAAMDTSSMSSAPMESSASATTTTSSAMTSSEGASSAASAPMANPQFTILSGYTQASTDQMATNVIGAHVYDGTAQNANDLGKINDLVLNQNGSIAAVIVGVGGFLGIGEKQVAVDYQALQWEVGPDNNRRFVLQTTKDELTSAPDFKTVNPNQPSGASNGASVPASGAQDNGMSAANPTSSSAAQ
jgi:sporulation protein YlmC with PRC-barrel domain